MAETVRDLLIELAHDNPRPEEPWFLADQFDPPWKKGTLREAAKRRLIELDTAPEVWRFRFTEKGRFELSMLEAANG